MKGKETCRILKQIRAEIARRNDIEFVVRECTHQGDCRGTCPRCESEVRYLEEQLAKRRSLRKTVALAGVSAGMVAALSGCSAVDALVNHLGGTTAGNVTAVPTEEILAGEIAYPEETPEPEEILEGAVEYVPETMGPGDAPLGGLVIREDAQLPPERAPGVDPTPETGA